MISEVKPDILAVSLGSPKGENSIYKNREALDVPVSIIERGVILPRVIALYLPQFHPIPENDEWYGKGFTEWTNVAKARPLFKGHNQPRIPADLGFYDLRLPEIRYAQAKMAHAYGIEGFAYYHYWFGDGRQLLEKPFQAVLADKEYKFPFMLHWANGSWSNKLWNPDGKGDKLLMEQRYPGKEDAVKHFYTLLPAFTDERYMRIDGKLMFTVDSPLNSEEIPNILYTWRELAAKEGIGDFFFIAHARHHREWLALSSGGVDGLLGANGLFSGAYDAVIDSHIKRVMYLDLKSKALHQLRKKLNIPNVYNYQNTIDCVLTDYDRDERVFPEIFPNFDHSPRSKGKELIYIGDTPALFKKYAKNTLEMIKDKSLEHQIIFIRAWNEWGEGNYLEPDIKNGLGYLQALKESIDDFRRRSSANV